MSALPQSSPNAQGQAGPGLAAAVRARACVCSPHAGPNSPGPAWTWAFRSLGQLACDLPAPEIGAAVHIPPVLLAHTSKNMSMNACDMQVHNAGPS